MKILRADTLSFADGTLRDSMAGTCDIKGQGFQGCLLAIEQLHGVDGRQRVLDSLRPELKSLFTKGALLASGWYPLTSYAELHSAARQCFGKDVNRQLGRVGARNDVQSVFRFILSLGSPTMLLRLSSRVFGMYVRGAKMEWKTETPTAVHIQYFECVGASESTWEDFAGTCEEFLEFSGAKRAVMTLLSGGHDGEASAEYRLTWES